tara:strand:- start:1332 stop:1883 length:552 start_codon:yes stop_codon:yes gene_type:complete
MNKKLFIQTINLYHPFMNYYQMVKIYFKLIDSIYPNYKHDYLEKSDVFNRLYSERKPPYYNCCTLHASLKNFQKIMFKKLKTNYEKSIYKKTSNFFIDLNLRILIRLDKSYQYQIFKRKYSKILPSCNPEIEFSNLIKKKYGKWELFRGYISINRKGRIVDVKIPDSEIIRIKNRINNVEYIL